MVMAIVFKKIPKLALYFYAAGFTLLVGAMLLYFYFPKLFIPATLQQIFIGGAIIVATGSVINTISQFSSTRKPNNQSQLLSKQKKE